MLRAWLITLFLLCAGPLTAQGWTAEVSRDEIYDAGRVFMPGRMINISCAAPTGRANVTPDSRWWEVSVAPPWQYLLDFANPMVPEAQVGYEVEMILFADGTGYKLPLVSLNELEGGWQVILPMSDPVFGAAAVASRLILQVGPGTAWELPVAGLAGGLNQIRDICVSGWQARGIPGSAGAIATPAAALDLRAVAAQFAAQGCGSTPQLGLHALKEADIDGDGHKDVVLDYNDIACGADRRRPQVCGMNTCSIDVFLSRTFPQTGQPENLLGTSAAFVPLSNGSVAVSASGNLSMCQSTEPCAFLFYWDGARFTDLKQ